MSEVGFGTIVPGRAQVSVDPNTNSIIVIADRSVQQVYEELIKSLDRRRPQVMLEAKIVILDTTDDFSLGVEVSGGDRTGLR
ncbi:MAG: secretin N-terminal domain-containing protein, partial [Phycisphaerae bacterium]